MSVKQSLLKFSLFIFIQLFLFNCQAAFENVRKKNPVFRSELYNIDLNTNIIDRVAKTPKFVMDYLKKMDGRDDYKDHDISPEEINVIKAALKKLPPLNKKIMQNRLLGIYFIDNFMGSGFAEIVFDKNGKVYSYLVFNSSVLTKKINNWLRDKVNTCFLNESNSNIKITFEISDTIDAFLPILIHESTHVVDYVRNITPWVTNEHRINLKKIKYGDFVLNRWSKYSVVKEKNEFYRRSDITFYGFSGGPKIKITDAIKVYKSFSKTDFISLYSSKSWAEDLCEFVTFYHLTQKLNLNYKISIKNNNKLVFQYLPFDSSFVKSRFKYIEKTFY